MGVCTTTEEGGLFAVLAVGALFLKDGERALSSSGVKRTTRELVRSFLAWLLHWFNPNAEFVR